MACNSGGTSRSHDTRKPRFEVRDVLEILLDGNSSDFDEDESDTDNEDIERGDDYEPDASEDQLSDFSDDTDDLPLSSLLQSNEKEPKRKQKYKWVKKDFQPDNSTFTGPQLPLPVIDLAGQLRTPLQYFRSFFTDEMVRLIVVCSNQYGLQKNGAFLNTNEKEIEQLIGVVLRMGIVQMPGVRVYYEEDTRYGPVADVIGRNRLQLLLRTLHFVDNEAVPDQIKRFDKLWKIRPFLDMFRAQCLLVPCEEKQAIDEMMVPFKGRFSKIKQYMRGKPKPWGIKIWCRCSTSGLLHDFDVYQGKLTDKNEKSLLGVGGDVIKRLCSTLPQDKNYTVFADNFFTSVALIDSLKNVGFQYTGTVRSNRLGGCVLKSEKELAKSGRGSFDYRVEQTSNIICVRWLDTKMVTLMSTNAGIQPIDTATRWDKKAKEHKAVPRPFIIKEYNSNMGGIDLLDSCIARYKFLLKSRRWYMYLFWQSLHLAVVNAWLLYRRDCKKLSVAKPLILRTFQAKVASGLIEVNTVKKRGRPSMEAESPSPLRRPKQVRRYPSTDAQKDRVDHWPIKVDNRRRCAFCQMKTVTNCTKCNVPLCFTEKRNCFYEFHV